jgi:UDP-2,3-diacylglucosamine hydrolase
MVAETLFISDLHLSEANTHLNLLFDHFIENTLSKKNIDAVYILGDFFNVWVGDDAMGEWELHIAEKLARLVKQQIPVYIMVGNRDFLLQKTFVQLAQATLLPDPTIINLYGKRVILKHGDDLCLADKSYQWFRKCVRSCLIKKLYLSLPLLGRQSIANRLRKNSHNREMRAIYAQILPSQVQELLQKYQADWLINGHTHCPQIEPVVVNENKTGQHIILSDWNQQGNQLVVSSESLVFLDYFE